MPEGFRQLLQTPSVERAQQQTYGRVAGLRQPVGDVAEALGPEEVRFIQARDSFYLSSVGETGWPYVQHRGGPPGFLTVLDSRHFAFVEMPGNRQLITAGNVAARSRVALFLMDYPARERLKILGHAQTWPAAERPDLVDRLPVVAGRKPERVMLIEVAAFDWNCPQYITPRYTRSEIDALVAPLRQRITELETELERARQR